MRRRRFLIGLGGAGGLVLTGGVGLLVGRGGDSGDGAPSEAPQRTTAKLEVRDLVEQTTVSGTIGYGGSRELAIPLHGTITALPAPGTTIDRGGQLAEVDGDPVLLLFGDRPMWRPLPPPDPNVGGPDVEQLEANLVELGHGSRGNLGPNAKWTVATATGCSALTVSTTSPSCGNVSALIFSTKTSMIPPQVSPTANASSSLTP